MTIVILATPKTEIQLQTIDSTAIGAHRAPFRHTTAYYLLPADLPVGLSHRIVGQRSRRVWHHALWQVIQREPVQASALMRLTVDRLPLPGTRLEEQPQPRLLIR